MGTVPPQQLFGFPVAGSRLLTVPEVSAFLRCARSTIRKMADTGELDVHRRHGEKTHIRFTRRSMIYFLAKSATNPNEDELFQAVDYLASALTPQRRKALATALLAS
jgi:excisionase family DNA binding protein